MILNKFFDKLLNLAPLHRRFLLIAADALLLPLAVWLSFWLQYEYRTNSSIIEVGFWFFPAVLLIGLPLYAFSGQYKGLTRYVGSRAIYQLALRNGLLVLTMFSVGGLLGLPMPPRSSWLLLAFAGFTGGALCFKRCAL